VGERTLALAEGPASALLYDWMALGGGATVRGPAVAAGGNMTCLVPPRWELGVDELGNGVLCRSIPSTERQP
jgi:N-methylhydantoinase A/oxoprolinase/acetone carboxylase beta subunit